ncbi:MAG TPA: UvrD-helicase domain-containing protein, partial [Bacteroidales bacterium]|nr:UvrD-helicase domain-containing protein [Bacteroidales bacterium]
ADDDAPFIYEKIGTTYDHFIIDEFQDTSQIQWQNFMPLINETLSRGMDNLVVGDIKQSIYRWRNSDWRILHSEVNRIFGDEAVKTMPLNVNYRSRANIISFNNHIFRPQSIPALCDSKLSFENLNISSVYTGSEQKGTTDKPGGLVRVALYPRKGEEQWKESVLLDLPGLIEELQDKGYKANDIMFLCRTNEEGKKIINSILEHSSACSAEKLAKYNFEVTSGESLFLERNPAVSLLLSCLRYLVDPGSRVNRSLMVRSFALATGADESSVYSADTRAEIPAGILPDGWEESLNEIRNSSLFTAAEKMIQLFGLGNSNGQGQGQGQDQGKGQGQGQDQGKDQGKGQGKGQDQGQGQGQDQDQGKGQGKGQGQEKGHGKENVAFINSFQDVVLWYSSRYSSDISSFVAWWETEGYKKTVAQSDRQEAIRVMTIHKAKGLQSSVVIIPFASWEFSRHGFSRPLLWVRNVPEQFAPMPVVLPELTAQLENTYFAKEAALEKASEWLDGINMLYVAFTRPVDALFIMAPEDKKSANISGNTESLLVNALHDGIGDAAWKESGNIRSLTLGELPMPEDKSEKDVITMDRYPVSERRGTMRLRTGGALPLDEIKLDEPGGRAYGIMMHELLSRVTTLDDITKAVEHVCDRGLVNNAQRDQLSEKVRLLLTSGKVGEWFDGSSAVRTEATIILPTGAARRPDRVMMKNGDLSVLDFKFGEPSDDHIRQAAGYRQLLEEMGYTGVRSYLWYVEKDIVREA